MFNPCLLSMSHSLHFYLSPPFSTTHLSITSNTSFFKHLNNSSFNCLFNITCSLSLSLSRSPVPHSHSLNHNLGIPQYFSIYNLHSKILILRTSIFCFPTFVVSFFLCLPLPLSLSVSLSICSMPDFQFPPDSPILNQTFLSVDLIHPSLMVVTSFIFETEF